MALLSNSTPASKTICATRSVLADGIGEENEKRIRIGIAKDGSGVGAALIALVAAQQENNINYVGELRERLGSLKEGDEDDLERALL